MDNSTYIYRFRHDDYVIHMGISHSLYKTYKRFFPTVSVSNKIVDYCIKHNIYYNSLILEYLVCDSVQTADEELKILNENPSENRIWTPFVPKSKKTDDINYKNKLYNKFVFLTAQVKKDEKLHKFLIDNFNSTAEYIFFDEQFDRPLNWDKMSSSEKETYVRSMIDTTKRYRLEREYNIRLFTSFEIEEEELVINVKEKIQTLIIPYVVSVLYNDLIYTSHDLNILLTYLNEPKIMVKKEDIPYYSAIKPLQEIFTKEHFKKTFAENNKNKK